MPALHIRDISDTLMKRLKSDAALNGITLREHVINQLGGQKTKDRVSEDLPRPAQVPVVKRGASRSERVSASSDRVDLDATSSKDTAIGKVSLPTRQVPRCEHGTEKGYHCWQCGGLAKVAAKHE